MKRLEDTMEYKKVNQRIEDVVNEQVRKLEQLFPAAVKDGEVDFQALREELGQFEDTGVEKYELTWAGKKNAKKIAQEEIVGKTLKFIPEDSKNADITENLYIEGDNLKVLKLLRQNYYGAIKMIYIDPPYNTGNDFVYNDSFVMEQAESDFAEGYASELGEKYVLNSSSQNRYHANWMNMMYPRLKIAKDILSEQGAIFISIDDHECENLKGICDEIFGENNFVAKLAWQRTYSIRNDSKGIPAEVEYVLVYSKTQSWEPNKLPRTEEMDSAYSNPDGDVCAWMSGSPVASDASTHQGMVYAIQHPFTGKMLYPSDNAHWRYSQDQMLDYMQGWCKYKLEDLHDDEQRAKVCGIAASDIRKGIKSIVLEESLEISAMRAKEVYEKGPWPRFYFTSGGKGGIRRKVYLDSVGGRIATNFWGYDEVGHTDEAKKEVKLLFDGSAPFDTPKPTRLLDRILTIATDKDSIILDFFSGSATTAHATMKKNLEDQGNRKFILVQLPETSKSPEYNNLCEIGKERIRRAGEKIKQENPESNIDIGFKVFRVADTNIKWNSLMNAGQLDMAQIESTPDLVDFMLDAKDVDIVYELMLRQRDVPLSETLEQLSDIGNRTYLYASSYLVCLETEITVELINKLAELDPLPIKFIFRDSAFKDDIALKDETFRRLKALVEKNAGGSKITYTVEFI